MSGLFRCAVLAALAAPLAAGAYSIESVATNGCHEKVTRLALTRAGWPAGIEPSKPNGANTGLAEAVAFTTAKDSDEWLLTLLVAVRDNDLHGAGASEFTDLSNLHNAADGQEEHCLRAPRDDGNEGDVQAVEACRSFIAVQLGFALGDDEQPDWNSTERLVVALRDQTAALTLPRYPLKLGRALHALQDSFTHTFRTSDFAQVTTVFNYADPATASSYVPERDGLEHRSDFDSCAAIAGRQAERVEASITASVELMQAVGNDRTRAERLARADAVLAKWITLSPGCGPDTDWCGSAEPPPAKCSATAGGPALLLALMLLRRRARHL